jgi:hypothetical protein
VLFTPVELPVSKEFMKSRGLIASWLLVTVLLAPVLGLAVCVSAFPAATVYCMHCCMQRGMQSHRMDSHAPASAPLASAPVASAPVAPCC